jgi:hypothetical protein
MPPVYCQFTANTHGQGRISVDIQGAFLAYFRQMWTVVDHLPVPENRSVGSSILPLGTLKTPAK